MKKRLLALALVCAMLLAAPALAAETEAGGTEAADSLYSLGLFAGTGTDANGAPVYELDRAATRTEALVMLIRLLGREAQALASTGTHPFTDVPNWAAPYVAYGYENGLTNGMSQTEFGAGLDATANMYLSFVLRALGYTDSGESADFAYTAAGAFAREIGLAVTEYGEDFLRADAVIVSHRALAQPLKGGEMTLIQSLVEAGAVDPAAAVDAGFALLPGQAAVTLPVTTDETGSYTLSAAAIKAAFPAAAQVAYSGLVYSATGYYEVVGPFMGFTQEEIMLNSTLYNSAIRGTNLVPLDEADSTVSFPADNTQRHGVFYVVDENFKVLGFYGGELDAAAGTATIRRMSMDTTAALAEMRARLDTALSRVVIGDMGRDSSHAMVDLSVGYNRTEDEDGAVYCTYPVYIDGQPLAEGEYAIALRDYIEVYTTYSPEAFRNLLMRQAYYQNYAATVYLYEDGTVERSTNGTAEQCQTYYESTGETARGVRLQTNDFLNSPGNILVVAFDAENNIIGYDICGPLAYSE